MHARVDKRALLCAAVLAGISIVGSQAASAQTAQAPSPGPSPTAAATPTPSPTPFALGTIGGDFTVYAINSDNANAVGALGLPSSADSKDHSDLGNLLINGSYTSGLYKLSASAGAYSFLTIGQAINQTLNNDERLFGACANTSCYTALPQVQLTYTSKDQHWTVFAGKLGTLLGAEGIYTYQNVNIQRGLAWALEPVISRGVHVGYTNGPWTVAAEANDGYYSGWSHIAAEYEVSWAPSANTSVTFYGINPGSNTPGNPTAFVANKSEYNLVYSRTIGKFSFTPYGLFVSSPASSALSTLYGANWGAESAWAVSLLGAYNWSPLFSLGFRIEDVADRSSTTDASINADLLGYGPGSGALTYTLTPTYKFSANGLNSLVRLEFSRVQVRNGLPGVLFGPLGTATAQNRIGIEFGATK